MIIKNKKIGLHYESPQNTKYVYTDYPTGDLDVQRAIEGEAKCWRRLVNDYSLQKKKIVVSDWSTRYGIYEDSREILLWEKLRHDDYEIIRRFDDKPKHRNTLIKEYAEQDIASDEIYIADYSHTQLLLKEMSFYRAKLELNINKIYHLPEDELENLLSSIPDDPRITLVVHDAQVLENEKIISFLRRHPALDLSSSDIKWTDLQTLFLNVPHLKELRLAECSSLEEFPAGVNWPASLESLELIPSTMEYSFDWRQVEEVFTKCQNLKKLNLSCNDQLNEMPYDIVWPPNLESLDLSSTEVTWIELQHILSRCKKLQNLNLDECQNLGDFVNDFVWPKELKTFILGAESTSYSWEILQTLQTQCKQIQDLWLCYCKFEDDFPDGMQAFEMLNSLHINNTNITWDQIATVTKGSPLKIIDLGSCKMLGEIPQYLEFPELEELEELAIPHINISWKDIQRITRNNTCLKKLILTNNSNLSDIPEDLELPALQSIIFSCADITWEDISRLVKISPCLNDLTLSYCKYLGEIPEDLNLSKLETINLSGTGVTWVDIKRIANNNKNLQELRLDECENLGIIPNDLKLSLNLITISKNQISLEQVAQILKGCPELKILSLYSCRFTGEVADLPEDNQLKSIYFNYSEINYDQIKMFLKKCKHLESIKCSNLTSMQVEEINKEYPHLFIISMDAEDSIYQEVNIANTDEVKIDSRTMPSDKPISTNQYFKYKDGSELPDPGSYRLSVYDHVKMTPENVCLKKNEDKNYIKVFSVDKISQQQLDVAGIYKDKYENEPNVYFGKMKITEDKGDSIPLPSLSVEDQLYYITTTPPVEFDIDYCEEEGLYYINPKEVTHPIEVSFIIRIPDILNIQTEPTDISTQFISELQFDNNGLIVKNNAYLHFNQFEDHEKIQILINYFVNDFTCDELSLIPDDDISLINLIIHERKGSCRHRALAFMAIAQSFNLNARAIYNDCHAYIEINYGNKWYQADLGGAPAELEMKSLHVADDEEDHEKEREKEIVREPSDNSSESELIVNNPFCTWEKLLSDANTMNEYTLDLIRQTIEQAQERKNILSLMSPTQIESFYTAMLRHSHCFYLHDLDNVRTTTITVDNDTHAYTKIDSALVRFLKQARAGDVLIVNWSHYEANHVGFNTIMDQPRTLNGIPIPEGVIIVGVLDINKTMSEDFYSRFSKKIICPERIPPISLLPRPVLDVDPMLITIDFFDDDWKSTLLGKLKISKNGYTHDESKLCDVLKKSKHIVFKNAPWHLAEFRLFMTEILSKGQFEVNRINYELPFDLKIIRDDTPYKLGLAQHDVISYQDAVLHDAYILNQTTLHSLFYNYHCNEKQQLCELNGLLAAHSRQILRLIVTDTLTVANWAKILKEAEKYEVKLELIAGPNTILPKEFGIRSFHSAIPSSMYTQLICTNDIDLCSDIIQAEADSENKQKTIVISVNENTSLSDLCERIKLIDHDGTKLFEHSLCALAQGLLSGHHIILKGNFSPTLAKQLESLFLPSPYLVLNGEKHMMDSGKITLITRKKTDIHLVPTQNVHYEQNDFWDALKEQYDEANIDILRQLCREFCLSSGQPEFGFAQLKSMLNRMCIKPKSNPIKPFIRLRANYGDIKSIADQLWRKYGSSIVRFISEDMDAIEKRVKKILNELNISQYLFIAGQSGIGKSYFIQEELKQCGFTILEGMDKLNQLLEPSLTPRILFIDEANLYQPGTFDIFEGLFNSPPELLINGQLHRLSLQDKIIFAGNFGNYKGRLQHEFFSRHGQAIIFKELPDSVLHERILNPIMKELSGEESVNSLCELENIFIDIYHYVNGLYPDKCPLTARNLQMMALRFAVLKEHMDLNKSACIAAYDEVHDLLNKKQRMQLRIWMKDKYSLDTKTINKECKNSDLFANSQFHLTTKRMNVVRKLNDIMQIKNLKMYYPSLTKKGINGLIMEGEAGIGKSLLAKTYLESQGFIDGNIQRINEEIPCSKRYYHLTPTDPTRMQELLTRAFHEGAVVIIDEMNTMPLEVILNPLLSGVDLEGRPAANSGFFIIATQNPVSYGNRQALSSALLNRFQRINLKDYTKEDLLEITRQKVNDPIMATTLVDFYMDAKKHAKKQHITPEPTARDLFRMAENLRCQNYLLLENDVLKDFEMDEEKSRVKDKQSLCSIKRKYQHLSAQKKQFNPYLKNLSEQDTNVFNPSIASHLLNFLDNSVVKTQKKQGHGESKEPTRKKTRFC